jgi:hypothetical protein
MKTCIACKTPLIPTIVKYRGESYDTMRCPKCKINIFTEDLAINALKKMEGSRLKKEYVKKPLHMGRSIGMTFPKDVSNVFNLKGKNKKIRLLPNIAEGKIVLEVEG